MDVRREQLCKGACKLSKESVVRGISSKQAATHVQEH